VLDLELFVIDNLKKIIGAICLESFLRKHDRENGHCEEEEVA
jgi:hypothetical protein